MAGTVAVLTLAAWLGFGVLGTRERQKAEVATPGDLNRLDPQLAAYLVEKIEWVKKSPADPGRHAELGLVYAANSLWSEARKSFATTAALRPKDPLPRLYVGVATAELEGLQAAVPLFQEVTLLFPEFAPGWYRVGDGLLRLGNYREATPAFDRLIRLAPGEWRGYAGLGEIKLREKSFGEAVELLTKALTLDPESKTSHHLLGQALRALGQNEAAERELRLGLNSEHYPMPDAWSISAHQHMRLVPDQIAIAREHSARQEFGRAIDVLKPALRWHPEDVDLMNQLGQAYLNSGQPELALEVLRRATAVGTNNIMAFIHLSQCWLDLGRNDEALAAAGRAVGLGPDLPQTHLARATVLRERGEHQSALLEFEAAARCDPTNPLIPMETGDVLLRSLNRAEDALAHFQKADRLDPNLPLVKVRLADVFIRLNRTNEAAMALEETRRLAPNEPVIAILAERLRRSTVP